MPAPSVTYTFSNSTTADATQVNQNFTDLINGLSDGTKDLSISALTCAGNATFNGNTAIGNASGDDLTITASLASTIAIKTTNSYDIGSSTLGLRALYFGANSQTVNIKASSSMSATWTFTLPVTAGTAGFHLSTDGAGVTSWATEAAGVSTNSSASAGYKGEYIESVVSAVNFPASGAYGDLTSISLTAGDWDVSAGLAADPAGATVTGQYVLGITTTSGNSAAGLAFGSNSMVQDGISGANFVSMSVPSFRVSLSGTTTYYMKYRCSAYSVATPAASGRISARRIR